MPAHPQAGDLDHRITIQRATHAAGDYNEPIETWADLVTVSSQRTDASTAEMLRAQEVGAQISCRFLVRWSEVLATVTPADRIISRGRTFNITGVKEVRETRNAWIEINAAARAE